MKGLITRRQPQGNADLGELHPLLKKIYSHRGVESVNELKLELNGLLPFTDLSNIELAVSILIDALAQRSRIMIVGDFDSDGATSTTLAIKALKAMGAADVLYLVPNRFEYGYGLTPGIVSLAAKQKPDLIITVDNGISSIEGVKAATEHGIKVLITDHHLAGDSLPAAAAIVNPNLPGDKFASKNLAGVGVIFYVMLALRSHLREINWFAEKSIAEPNMGLFLDLVALGTVADVVPLDYNNRILVRQGLRVIKSDKVSPGIKALLTVARRPLEYISASDLGFAVGPRLNAAGRLDDMSIGIECLLTDNGFDANRYAEMLEHLNKERRSIENEMKQQAFIELNKLKLGTEKDLPPALCLHDENWHQGVIGILASRVKDAYHRPVIAFAPVNKTEIKGSARSIQGLHIRDVLDIVAKRAPEVMDKFGGHAMAAGLSLRKENYEQFVKIFTEVVDQQTTAASFRQEILSDGELESEYFTTHVAQLIRDGGPWGQQFPEPLFDGEFRLVEQRIVGARHLKCLLGLNDSDVYIDAIAFNIDEDAWPNHRCKKIHCTYRLDINEYRGNRKVQLIIDDLQALP